MDKKIMLTETEVASLYSLGLRQLRLMRMRGDGPVWIKVSGRVGCTGGRVLYPSLSLEAWIASRPGGGEKLPKPVALWPPVKEVR